MIELLAHIGYLKIGSLVMLLHDISDIPLAILMICFNLKFWYFVQVASQCLHVSYFAISACGMN